MCCTLWRWGGGEARERANKWQGGWSVWFWVSDLELAIVFHVERARVVSSMVLCTGSGDVSRGTSEVMPC